MTQNNYRYLFILGIFSIFLIALGCEQDDGYIQTQDAEQNSSRYNIDIIGKEKVNSNTPLSNKLKSLMPKKIEKESTSTLGREIYSSEYGMTVNTEYVKFIEDVTTGYHSYNFPVYLDSLQDDTLRNLTLSLNPNGHYDAFIVDYGILISDLTNPNQNNYPTSNATMHYVDFDASAVIAAKKDYPHYECTFEWGPEYWQHPCYEENAADCITQDLISWECIVETGGGSGSSNDTSNDGTNSSNGGSGGDGNTGCGGGTQNPENPDYDPTDPDVHGNGGQPVLTAPAFEDPEQEEEDDPCDNLKELSEEDNQNIDPEIAFLIDKLENSASVEWGSRFKRSLNNDGTHSNENIRVEGNGNGVSMVAGWNYIGGGHIHTKKGYNIYSFGDLSTLAKAYSAASAYNLPYVTLILVCHNPAYEDDSTLNEFNIYALKADNPQLLISRVNNIWNSLLYSQYPEDIRMNKILQTQEPSLKANKNNLEKYFLQRFGTPFGLELYKADTDLNNWNKLSLENGGVIEQPCE